MSASTSGLVVPDLLALRVAQGPDDTVMNVNDASTITYGEWDRRSNAVARGLVDRGVSRGAVVALFYGGMEWIDYIVAYMSVLKSGGTAIHLNDTMPREEVQRRLDQCAVVGIVRAAHLAAPSRPGAWIATTAELASADTGPVGVVLTPEDVSDILYSSGTTQLSKGLRVPHGNLTFGRGPEGFKQFGDPRPLITPMQLGTTASVTTTNVAISLQATLVVAPPGDVERMGALIAKYGVGSVMVNPMIGVRMVTARIHERHDLSSVHTLGTAAAAMPPAIADKLLGMFPNARLTGTYTEIGAVPGVIVTTYDPAKPHSVGRPSPSTRLQVTDADGNPVPDGTLGEIRIRAAAPKRRHVDESLEPADGWTRTHDLGVVREDGELYLFDRAVDAIRVDGELISTLQTEAAVYECPDVREAAIVGLPGADGTTEIALVVALTEGGELERVREFAAERLRPQAQPTRFLVVDALPFGPNGKVRKTELRKQLLEPVAV
ncbi:MAG TPA: class I adenylate-forming enzyme family protein [Actinocrinis sp.]|nr:class I adenylate-forming enzyme family protein [Actinocrinis sp.]